MTICGQLNGHPHWPWCLGAHSSIQLLIPPRRCQLRRSSPSGPSPKEQMTRTHQYRDLEPTSRATLSSPVAGGNHRRSASVQLRGKSWRRRERQVLVPTVAGLPSTQAKDRASPSSLDDKRSQSTPRSTSARRALVLTNSPASSAGGQGTLSHRGERLIFWQRRGRGLAQALASTSRVMMCCRRPNHQDGASAPHRRDRGLPKLCRRMVRHRGLVPTATRSILMAVVPSIQCVPELQMRRWA